MNDKEVRVLELDKYEYGIVVNALNEFRNKVLSEGGMVGIFPEGTINRTDDIIMPFKKGAVRMSLENNCKILPFAINGKYKRGKLKIKFGDAYFPETNDIEKETKILEQKVIKLIKECE